MPASVVTKSIKIVSFDLAEETNSLNEGDNQIKQTLAVYSVQPGLESLWSLCYALHPHH